MNKQTGKTSELRKIKITENEVGSSSPANASPDTFNDDSSKLLHNFEKKKKKKKKICVKKQQDLFFEIF
jgi:hypothetical protein